MVYNEMHVVILYIHVFLFSVKKLILCGFESGNPFKFVVNAE